MGKGTLLNKALFSLFMNDPVIQLHQVRKHYGSGEGENSFTLLVPSLSLEMGSVNVIHGASGCGKSTLMDILGLISPPSSGEFYLSLKDGQNIPVHQAAESILSSIRRQFIGYVLQSGGLLGFMSVRDNIALSMRLAHGRVDLERMLSLAGPDQLNIEDCLHKKPGQLSLGQRQRAAIARALAHNPDIVIADEPTGAVDPERARQIKHLLLSRARESGVTTLVVTHDDTLFQKEEIDHLFTFRPLEGGYGTELVQLH